MGEWMEKYNDAERQLDHYRIQASKISRIVPQKIRELEEQVSGATRKYELERENNFLLEQRMTEDIAQHTIQNEKLSTMIMDLERQLNERDERIRQLNNEVDELRDLRKKDEDSVRQKVSLIKEHIQKSVKKLEAENQALEVENFRLKRQAESVESEKIRQLSTEICRLKEVNASQAKDRMAIFDEVYRKFCRDYQITGKVTPPFGNSVPYVTNGGTPPLPLPPRTPLPPPPRTPLPPSAWTPPYNRCSPSVTTSDPLYTMINNDDSRSQSSCTMGRNDTVVSPPLPPRRTSASKTTFEDRKRKLPNATCCTPCCPPTKSLESSQYMISHSEGCPSPAVLSSCHPVSPPPIALREEGDGSVNCDYDEIPYEPPDSNNSGVGSRSSHGAIYNSLQKQAQGNYYGNNHHGDNHYDDNPSHERPSRKRSWETLVDSLALVGFTDIIPQQQCVKSSIGKIPTYAVSEEISCSDHPYESPPDISDAESDTLTCRQRRNSVTEFERIVDRIIHSSEGSYPKQLLSTPLMSYGKYIMTTPLTNIKTSHLAMCALRINKIIVEFANKPVDLYTTCKTLLTLTNYELVNEVYAQLIKQTHRQPTEMLSYWHILALLIPFIIPTGRIMNYLKIHLCRYREQKNPAGRFAGYCYKVLQRRLVCGKRKVQPCRMEVDATQGRPYIHSKPMSIPIHMYGGDYHVTGFDTLSSVAEVIRDMESQLGLRTCRWSGYTLFMDDPLNRDVKVPVNHTAKLCDVIAKWESQIITNNNQIPQVIGLSYQKFLNLNTNTGLITNLEYKLSSLQMHDNMMKSYHGMEMELATCLGAMIAQVREGNCPVQYDSDHLPIPADFIKLSEYLDRYVPGNITSRCKDILARRQLVNNFGEIWNKFRDTDSTYIYKKFYNTALRWKYGNSTLFKAVYLRDGSKIPVCLSVTENKVTIINSESLVIIHAVDMDKINRFGGTPFSITVRINNKTLTFNLLDSHKSYMLTELLAAYCRLTHTVERDDS